MPNITDQNAFINSIPITQIPITALVNDFLQTASRCSLGVLQTRAEAISLASINISSLAAIPLGTQTAATFQALTAQTPTSRYLSVNRKTVPITIDFSPFFRQNLVNMRTDAAGFQKMLVTSMLDQCAKKISNTIYNLTLSQSSILDAFTANGVPSGNYSTGNAGTIDWNLAHQTPADPFTITIKDALDNLYSLLPPEMLPNGAYQDKIRVYVSTRDYEKMRVGLIDAYQFAPTGGFELNKPVFDLTQKGATIQQGRNARPFEAETFVYKNMAISPLTGLADDTILLTYQDAYAEKKVMYEKISNFAEDNIILVAQGPWALTSDFELPLAEQYAQAMQNMVYQLGDSCRLEKAPGTAATYWFSMDFGYGIIFRETDKIFAYLP
jgi:hypothetical protein